MTEQQKDKLRSLAVELREIALPVGPLSALWDVIFDIEAFIEGRPTIINKSAEEWISYAEKCIVQSEQARMRLIVQSRRR